MLNCLYNLVAIMTLSAYLWFFCFWFRVPQFLICVVGVEASRTDFKPLPDCFLVIRILGIEITCCGTATKYEISSASFISMSSCRLLTCGRFSSDSIHIKRTIVDFNYNKSWLMHFFRFCIKNYKFNFYTPDSFSGTCSVTSDLRKPSSVNLFLSKGIYLSN